MEINDAPNKPGVYIFKDKDRKLNAAIDTLKSLGLNINTASIAKDPDRLFLPDKEPVPISSDLSLFQSIRDEAHRFAISYHKKLRSSKS